MVTTEIKRYKTKPLELWGKSKELRDKYYVLKEKAHPKHGGAAFLMKKIYAATAILKKHRNC